MKSTRQRLDRQGYSLGLIVDKIPGLRVEDSHEHETEDIGPQALIALGGCATIIEGTSQEIMVSTNPAGASCVLEREGQPIATIPATPGTALIKKSKHDITIKCSKDGFETATYINNSGLASGSVAGNVAADLLLTAGLSSIIDSASGADNKYESPVNITLIPRNAAMMAPAAPTATTAPTTTMKPVAD